MTQFENNIRESFRGVKKDILEVKNQILKLAEEQQKIVEMILKESKKTSKKKTSKKKTSKKK